MLQCPIYRRLLQELWAIGGQVNRRTENKIDDILIEISSEVDERHSEQFALDGFVSKIIRYETLN